MFRYRMARLNLLTAAPLVRPYAQLVNSGSGRRSRTARPSWQWMISDPKQAWLIRAKRFTSSATSSAAFR